MLEQHYIDVNLMPLLLEKGCPLRLIRVRDEKYPAWYTLPYDDPDWQYCDAYYVPTQAEVIDWLSDEKKIDIHPLRFESEELFSFHVSNYSGEHLSSHSSAAIYKTREHAMDAGIKYAFVNYIN